MAVWNTVWWKKDCEMSENTVNTERGDGVSRRDFLRVGGLGVVGLSRAGLARAAAGFAHRRAILILMKGIALARTMRALSFSSGTGNFRHMSSLTVLLEPDADGRLHVQLPKEMRSSKVRVVATPLEDEPAEGPLAPEADATVMQAIRQLRERAGLQRRKLPPDELEQIGRAHV